MQFHSLFLFVFTLFVTVTGVCSTSPAPPSPPVWPAQWSSSVKVSAPTPNTILGPGTNPVAYHGKYYYNSQFTPQPRAVFNLFDEDWGSNTRILVQPGSPATYTQLDPSVNGFACSQNPTGSDLIHTLSPYLWIEPDFLTRYNFQYKGVDYLYRTPTYFSLSQWQYSSNTSQYMVNYYHSNDRNIPFRMEIGINPQWNYQAWNPVIIEFSMDFSYGFNVDSDELNLLFNVPAGLSCESSSSSSSPVVKKAPLQTPPMAAAWPVQFHCDATFTGNDYGFQGEKVQVTLEGHFYYDSTNNRECNIWHDRTSGERTKTVIVNGAFHAIQYSSGACVEPPVPITGSLHHNWTENLKYVDTRFLLRGDDESYFSTAQHFAWDAFNGGAEHAFQYFQLPSGEPMLFQGPVVDFPPYFQSFSQWSYFTSSLHDVNSTLVYSYPSDCKKIGPGEWDFLWKLESIKGSLTRQQFHDKIASLQGIELSLWDNLQAWNQYFPLESLVKSYLAHANIVPGGFQGPRFSNI